MVPQKETPEEMQTLGGETLVHFKKQPSPIRQSQRPVQSTMHKEKKSLGTMTSLIPKK